MEERKQLLIDFMSEEAYKPMSVKELTTVLVVPRAEKKIFEELLDALEDEGKIYKNKKNRYGVPERMNLIVGRLQGNERGYGFLIPDDVEVKPSLTPNRCNLFLKIRARLQSFVWDISVTHTFVGSNFPPAPMELTSGNFR